MTTVPRSLAELGTFWTTKGGVNLGVIGNQRHCRGYHLGRDRIYSTCACRPDGTCEPGMYGKDYSVQTSRDKAGLSNAASAIDLGKLNGSLEALWDFSDWLARRCLAGVPGTNDVREVIYSPDGDRVLGFKDGIDFLIPDYGDRSHLTHTHISFYRDSETRDKRPLFAPYFELPETTEEDMALAFKIIESQPGAGTVTVAHDNVSAVVFKDGTLYGLAKGTTKRSYAKVELVPPYRGIDEPLYLIGEDGAGLFASNVTFVPDPSVAAQRERDRVAHLANIEEVYST